MPITTCIYHAAPPPALTSTALVRTLEAALLSADGAHKSSPLAAKSGDGGGVAGGAEGAGKSAASWMASCTEYVYVSPKAPLNPSDKHRKQSRQSKKRRKLEHSGAASSSVFSTVASSSTDSSEPSSPSTSRLYRFTSSRYNGSCCYLRDEQVLAGPLALSYFIENEKVKRFSPATRWHAHGIEIILGAFSIRFGQVLCNSSTKDLGCLICIEHKSADGTDDSLSADSKFDTVQAMAAHIDAALCSYLAAERAASNRILSGSGGSNSSIVSKTGVGGRGAADTFDRILLPITADKDEWDKRRAAYHLPAESESMGESDAMRHLAQQFVDACIRMGDLRKR